MRNYFGAFLLLWAAAAWAQTAAPLSAPCSSSRPAVHNLAEAKRFYVDNFGSDETSQQFQAALTAALLKVPGIIVTENKEKADVILRGSGSQKSTQEVHAYSEGTAVGRSAIQDANLKTETTTSANVSLRAVNSDGDVLWATSEESSGAKYKGALLDAVDQAIKKLKRELAKESEPKEAARAASAK